jgi:hypothetical protein
MKVTVPRSHVYNFVEMETLGSDPLLMSSIARPPVQSGITVRDLDSDWW